MKSFFLLFALAIACTITKAQAPPNDNACQATQLTIGSVCNYQIFTIDNATNSVGSAVPNCANFVSGTTGDVWFRVTVPADGSLSIDTQEGTITDGGMAVYRGMSCNVLVLLACDDNSSANGDMPALTTTGLIPGSTVYIRFWEKGGDNNGTFGICVKNAPPPPSNDDPCNAIELPVGSVCSPQSFTNEGSTFTTSVPPPVCGGFLGGDVWFKVIVPASGGLSIDTQEGTTLIDGGMAVYSGTDCGSTLTLLACDDNSSANGAMPALTISGQSPGSTLWVRFWENGSDNNGAFGICVRSVSVPYNDNPCSAIELTAGTDCNYQTFTTENATTTTSVPAPACANYTGGDVWFKVTVPAGAIGLSFDTQTGVVADGGMAVYAGTSCNSLTQLTCDDNSSTNGLMPALTINSQSGGSTLWIRFWENGGDNNGTFGICARAIYPLPFNDDPCTARQLIADSVLNYQTFTTENSTATTGVPPPGCANYAGFDVWFKATVPASGVLFLYTKAGVINDGGMAVYTGNRCDSNLTLLACDDDSMIDTYMPFLAIKNQPPGSTLWVRFWDYNGNSNGTFSIGASAVPDITYARYPVYIGNVLQFTDTATTYGGYPIVSWHWDFGNGDTSNLQNPAMFTSSVDPFTVVLTMKNSNNNYWVREVSIELAISIVGIQEIKLCSSADSAVISSYVITGNPQWQMRTDSTGFTNISDNINFSGTNTPVLTLRNIASSWNGNMFRCRSDEGYQSWEIVIKVGNEFTNADGNNWENPANWSCGSLPDGNTDVIINGIATLNSNASCRTLRVAPGATFTISPGYNLTVTH